MNVSNQWQLDCLSKSLFLLTAINISKVRLTGQIWWESTGDQCFPSQGVSYAERATCRCHVQYHEYWRKWRVSPIWPYHYHHCANLSEGIELIKCLSDIFVECVSKIKYILSVIHYTMCGAVCFQFTNFSYDDWENIYTLSYYHHQIGSMNYYPLFRVRVWNYGVRCMSYYILMA